MQKLEYVIRNLDPVNFSEKSGDAVLSETKKFIPGSAIRGACAAQYIKEKQIKKDAHLDDGFNRLFLSGKVRFLPAYPCCSVELLKSGYRPIVIPVSIMKSKLQRDDNNYIDVALDNDVKAGYKKVNGFAMFKTNDSSAEFIKADTRTGIEFHMARNDAEERICGGSINKNIFNYEYIEPNQYFVGSILYDDDVTFEEIRNVFKKELCLGRSKTAQYGKCECFILTADSEKSKEIGDYSCLYFKTPYIPETEWQNIKNPVEELITALQESGINISYTSGKIIATSEIVNGFVGVWNLKRECVNAISAGSLVGVEIGQDKQNLDKLRDILAQGLGCRTEDGYGQLELWKPFSEISFSEAPKEVLKCVLDEDVKARARVILEKRLFVELHKQCEMDAKSLYNVSAKHILKRIESLMGSGLTKYAIQSQIENMENTAQANLKNIGLKGSTVYDMLVGSSEAPYDFNILLKKMSIDDGQSLFKEIDFEYDNELAEKIYKEYWLWTMRFAAKKGGNSSGK